MKNTHIIISTVLLSTTVSAGQPYKELIPQYHRTTSNVMVRSIAAPTLGNLDYAAYNANPICFDKEVQTPKKPSQPVTVTSMKFNGAVKKSVVSLAETPLTKEEINHPMAWQPLVNKLWNEFKFDNLQMLGSKIIGEKWADPDIFKPYQEIAALYLHKNGNAFEFWVRIEFLPWVNFLKGIKDSDNDTFREIYCQLNMDSIPVEKIDAVCTWITTVYQSRELTKEEITDWANNLASYWYPTRNTDIVDASTVSVWPANETEPEIKKTMNGIIVANPAAIIKGNPDGTVIYNVFVVESIDKKVKQADSTVVTKKKSHLIDTAKSVNSKENILRFSNEIMKYGDYAVWTDSLKAVHDQFRNKQSDVSKDQMGIIGDDGWLFFRKSIDYILAGDLTVQLPMKNPLPHLKEFKSYLDKNNIQMLFVAVPCKEEIYSEKLGIQADNKNEILYPYGRKFLADLEKNGIEVIDLLPHFIAAKKQAQAINKELFQHQDTHWTTNGLKIAATLIADRIKLYPWYNEIVKKEYSTFDTVILRQGDIVERIPESDRVKYPAANIDACQVITSEKKKYVSDPSGPIVLIGDSFTGVFELVDCKSAGVGAHIAQQTGLPVDIMTSWGGGPMIMNKMVRMRKGMLDSKYLVIYMMTARDLYNYSQNWESLKIN